MMCAILKVLHVPDCPNLAPMLERLRQVTDLPVITRQISTSDQARRAGMAGSPTLLVNGADAFAVPGQHDHALACRVYRDEHDQPVPAPSVAQLQAALASAGITPTTGSSAAGRSSAEPCKPGAMLSSWRTRALPLDPIEKSVHHAILRGFAATGQPPPTPQLASLTMGSGRTSQDVLTALHNLDAIRLTADRQVAVAYPFSVRPTRHRVRITNRVDVYAMCAIDALGIAPMLGQDTRIDSVDVTTAQPIMITTHHGHTSWNPTSTVVFISTDSGGGPSADCCCDYLNFFTDDVSATAWTTAHPHIPGQILTQNHAETLAAELFGALLATT